MRKWLGSLLIIGMMLVAQSVQAQIVSQIPWTAGYGGTGFSTYTIGDMLYADTASTLAKLVSPVTGQVITSGGAGVAPAWSASPTLTTSLTTPLFIGGTAVGSTLTFKSTSAVGTTDAIIFQVGNNGGTESMRIIDSGNVGIGQTVPTALLDIKGTAAGAEMIIGPWAGSTAYMAVGLANSVAATTYNFISSTTDTNLYLNRPTGKDIAFREANQGNINAVIFRGTTGFVEISGDAAKTVSMARNPVANTAGNALTVQSGSATSAATDKNAGTLVLASGLSTGTGSGGINLQTSSQQATTNTTDNAVATRLALDGYGHITHTPAVGTATVAASFTLTGAAHTALTASTERFDTNFNSARTVQWATGALTTQRFNLFQAPTVGFVGGSTITNTCTLCVTGAPVSGTNATLSSTHGLLIQAGAVTAATNAFGLTANAPTGGTTNYAGQFIGEVLLGSTAFASLGTPANGAITFCNDCDAPTLVDSTCTSAGAKTGSFAVRANGAWKCIS